MAYAEARDTQAVPTTVRAWDLPTRLFKWALVLCVANAWASDKYGAATPNWHKWNGYTILILLVFRLFWGVVGGSTSRFSAFVTWPWAALAYGWAQIRGRGRHFLGHNPLGSWMILALMAAVGVQAVLGLYSADEDRLVIEGPLARTISDGAVDRAASLHRLGFNVILALICVHVAANLVYDLVKREGLIRAMITGRKPRAAYADMAEAQKGSPVAAVCCLLAACVVVFGGIVVLGGNPLR